MSAESADELARDVDDMDDDAKKDEEEEEDCPFLRIEDNALALAEGDYVGAANIMQTMWYAPCCGEPVGAKSDEATIGLLVLRHRPVGIFYKRCAHAADELEELLQNAGLTTWRCVNRYETQTVVATGMPTAVLAPCEGTVAEVAFTHEFIHSHLPTPVLHALFGIPNNVTAMME